VPAPSARRDRWWSVAPLTLLCVLALWWPQGGDAALFHVGGRVLREGGTYYRDFWDIKQPGIYLFYALGDAVGPDGLGPRLLELALTPVAGLAVFALARGWDLGRRLTLAAPTIVLAPYVLWSYHGGVGQVEGLVCLTFCAQVGCTWSVAPKMSWWRWLLGGLAAGATVVLKLLYGPLALLLLLGAVLIRRRSGDRSVGGALVFLAAAALLVLAAVGWIVAGGAGHVLSVTSFVLPPQVSVLPGIHPAGGWTVLARASVQCLALTAPLALVGALVGRRTGRGAEVAVLLAVALLAAVMALTQYPTTYRPLLLVVPVGLLALLGARALQAAWPPWPRGARTAVVAGLIVLALPLARGPVGVARVAPGGLSLSMSARLARDERLSDGGARAQAAPVIGRVPAGEPIYVLGDPRIYLWTSTRQAVEVHGWSPELSPDRVWRELDRELQRSRPALVYIDAFSAPYLIAHAPGVDAMLRSSYRVLATVPMADGSPGVAGTWWQTSQPGRAVPATDGVRLP